MICAANANTIVPDVPFEPFEKTFENTVVKSQANTNASDVPCVYFWYQFHRSLGSDDMCRKTNNKFQMYFILRCTFFSDVLFGANYTDRLGRMICAAKQASQKFQSGAVNHQTSDILDWTFYILCFNKIANYISVYNVRSIDAIVHATHNLIVLMIM